MEGFSPAQTKAKYEVPTKNRQERLEQKLNEVANQLKGTNALLAELKDARDRQSVEIDILKLWKRDAEVIL